MSSDQQRLSVDATATIPAFQLNRATTIQRVALRLETEDGTGPAWETNGDPMVIGTHASVDLKLSDPSVSRFHCELTTDHDAVRLEDLKSSNGTFVDGVRVERCLLHPGATIRLGGTRLRVETRDDKAEVRLSENPAFGTMVGVSEPIRRVFAVLERAAQTDTTILLSGETGTGKEAAAESIHERSARASGPLVVVDCAAVPPNLLESELFGHRKGSFTGALEAREGAFSKADGGTIFLDEIGELPLELQPKLLRALEKRRVKPVGASEYRPVDVRVVAATNRELKTEVNEGRFRSDLYFRLAVLEVRLPPLRSRPEDIPILVSYLLGNRRDVTGDTGAFLRSDSFHETLAKHPWPGNVRELRNHLERCIALREAVQLEASPLSAEARQAGGLSFDVNQPYSEARKALLKTFERQYLEALLDAHGDNISEAARAAKVDRARLYRLLWRNGLRERS